MITHRTRREPTPIQRRSTLGPSSLDLHLIVPGVPALPRLTKQGIYLRSDHLAHLRDLWKELLLGPEGTLHPYSQNEMIRAAVDAFLEMDARQQLELLAAYRQEESELGVGRGAPSR